MSSCKSAKTAANGAPTKAIESKGDVPAKLSVDSEHNAAEFKTRNAGNGASMAYASHRIWTQSSQQACSKIPGFIQYWVDYTTAGLSGNKSPVLSANCSLKTFEYWRSHALVLEKLGNDAYIDWENVITNRQVHDLDFKCKAKRIVLLLYIDEEQV